MKHTRAGMIAPDADSFDGSNDRLGRPGSRHPRERLDTRSARNAVAWPLHARDAYCHETARPTSTGSCASMLQQARQIHFARAG